MSDDRVYGLAFLVLLVAPCAAQPQTPLPAPTFAEDQAMTIDELYAHCGIPGDCVAPLPCALQQYRINGFVNPINIWDKRQHPSLPESKFLLYNAARTLNLEVRVTTGDAPRLFDMLAAQEANWDGAVTLTGTLVSIDLPMMTSCQRALVMVLSETGSLTLGAGGAPSMDVHRANTSIAQYSLAQTAE